MKFLKHFSYSFSVSLFITSLALLFQKIGGEILLFPGKVIQNILQIFFLSFEKDDYWFTFPSETYFVFNIIIYAFVIFCLLWFFHFIKENAHEFCN